jgi:hypothetical protein
VEQVCDKEADERAENGGEIGDGGACHRRPRMKKHENSIATIAVNSAASNMAPAMIAQLTSQEVGMVGMFGTPLVGAPANGEHVFC